MTAPQQPERKRHPELDPPAPPEQLAPGIRGLLQRVRKGAGWLMDKMSGRPEGLTAAEEKDVMKAWNEGIERERRVNMLQAASAMGVLDIQSRVLEAILDIRFNGWADTDRRQLRMYFLDKKQPAVN